MIFLEIGIKTRWLIMSSSILKPDSGTWCQIVHTCRCQLTSSRIIFYSKLLDILRERYPGLEVHETLLCSFAVAVSKSCSVCELIRGFSKTQNCNNFTTGKSLRYIRSVIGLSNPHRQAEAWEGHIIFPTKTSSLRSMHFHSSLISIRKLDFAAKKNLYKIKK